LFVIKRHQLKIKEIYYLNKWKINTITNFNNIKTSYKENSKNILESSPNKRSKNSGKIKVSQNEAYLSKINRDEKKEFLLNCEEKVKNSIKKGEDRLLGNRLKGSKGSKTYLIDSQASKLIEEKKEQNSFNSDKINNEKVNKGKKIQREDHFSRLYEERLIRQKKQEENLILRDKMEIEECTFKPKTLCKSNSQLSIRSNIDYFNNVNMVS
jgi:hypothetical protein